MSDLEENQDPVNEEMTRSEKLRESQASSVAAKEVATDTGGASNVALEVGSALPGAGALKAVKGLKGAQGVAQVASADGITAFSAIDPGKDVFHYLAIIFAIIADSFGLIPGSDNGLAVFFAVIIWILYGLDGRLKDGAGMKIAVAGMAHNAEVFDVMGAGTLPLFTAAAVSNYWTDLAKRKAKMSQEEKQVA